MGFYFIIIVHTFLLPRISCPWWYYRLVVSPWINLRVRSFCIHRISCVSLLCYLFAQRQTKYWIFFIITQLTSATPNSQSSCNKSLGSMLATGFFVTCLSILFLVSLLFNISFSNSTLHFSLDMLAFSFCLTDSKQLL